MITATTKSAEETQALAASVAGLASAGDVVLLVGELGAGKTAFAQGFARGLGVDERVTSPTFTLVRTYEGSVRLHHLDVYRLDQLQEVVDLGLDEIVDDRAVTLVEWGDAIVPALAADFLEVRLAHGDTDDDRSVELRTVGSRWGARQDALADAVAKWNEARGC